MREKKRALISPVKRKTGGITEMWIRITDESNASKCLWRIGWGLLR